VSVGCVDLRSCVEQHLDRVLVSERGGPVQRCLPFATAVTHESPGLSSIFRHNVRFCTMEQKHLDYLVVHHTVFLAQCIVERRLSTIGTWLIHVCAVFEQKLA